MRVEILRATRVLSGDVGDVVDCDAATGNHLSCVGIVRVVQHDPPQGPNCVVKKNPQPETIDDDAKQRSNFIDEDVQPDEGDD